MENKSAVITIIIKEGKFYCSFKNDGFDYHEINGLLHEIITENILLKVAKEELKQIEKKPCLENNITE
jgi:hypothetical protein